MVSVGSEHFRVSARQMCSLSLKLARHVSLFLRDVRVLPQAFEVTFCVPFLFLVEFASSFEQLTGKNEQAATGFFWGVRFFSSEFLAVWHSSKPARPPSRPTVSVPVFRR
ncbi:hypothetical protein BV898_13840 [Hypsibius exemplaris]|uniref:Uncharacterized protein n=1 Tax=Hypsibius exemplaris TaxID=2072580 RepID=A0A1W0W9P2_HYPEX|nr:hypothetical protein BV898_13840 [Hypsibius exemplaris]